jgi:hypothetical protein
MLVRTSSVGSFSAVAGSVVESICTTTSMPDTARAMSSVFRKFPSKASTPEAFQCSPLPNMSKARINVPSCAASASTR